MTHDELTDEISACVPGGKAKFIITLAAALVFLVGGFISYFGERCAEHIDPFKARNPGPRRRRQLSKVMKQLEAELVRTDGDRLASEGITADQIADVRQDAEAAILAYGQHVTEEKLAEIRAMQFAPVTCPIDDSDDGEDD